MARETIKCPHCDCKVLLNEVEKDDGLCPECGQLVLSSSLFDDFDDEEDLELDEIEDDLDDDDDEDDDLSDEDDFDDDPAIHRQPPFRRRKRSFE